MTLALRPRTTATLAASAALAVALAACGSDTIATDKVESTIVAQFQRQGIPLTDTTCEDVEPKVGSPVRCTALNPAETKLVIEGKVTSRDGDKARFNVKAVRGEAKGTAIAAEARAILEAQVGEKAKDFTCPATITIPTARPARCTITVRSGKRYGVDVKVDGNNKISAEVDTEPLA